MTSAMAKKRVDLFKDQLHMQLFLFLVTTTSFVEQLTQVALTQSVVKFAYRK